MFGTANIINGTRVGNLGTVRTEYFGTARIAALAKSGTGLQYPYISGTIHLVCHNNHGNYIFDAQLVARCFVEQFAFELKTVHF